MSFVLDFPLRFFLLSPRKLADRLNLTARSRVLEVGVGSGFYSVEVARRVYEGRLELLDLQLEMLKKARLRLEAEGLCHISYTRADASNLPFTDRCFDVVFLVAVWGEVADQGSFLTELHRVLKPKGILSISEHYPDPDFSPFTEVKSLVEKQGFEFFERYGSGCIYTLNCRKSPAVNWASCLN